MNNIIDIEEILYKYGQKSSFYMKQALKEIVEEVVDKCAEEAAMKSSTYERIRHGGWKKETEYIHSVDKKSILKVKKLVKIVDLMIPEC